MLSIPLQHQGLQLFRPPYRECTPIDPNAHPGETEPGHAAVWFMSPEGAVEEELRWSALRPASLPLFVVLPPPALVPDLADACSQGSQPPNPNQNLDRSYPTTPAGESAEAFARTGRSFPPVLGRCRHKGTQSSSMLRSIQAVFSW